MPDLGIVEWIILGLIAGAISGALVGGRTARGCLPNIVVGIVGGVIGGWLADQMGLGTGERVLRGDHRGGPRRGRRPPRPQRAGPQRMTDSPPADAATETAVQATRPYSPGLEGVIAGETSLSYIDGAAGRLLYRGYRIGDLVERGTYPAVANLLWTGEWDPSHRLSTGPLPAEVLDRAAGAAGGRQADGRAADRGVGVGRDAGSAVAADRRGGTGAHGVLADGARGVRPAAVRRRPGRPRPVARPDRGVPVPAHRRAARRGHGPGARCVLHRRSGAQLQRLDVHGAGHHLDPFATSRRPWPARSAR